MGVERDGCLERCLSSSKRVLSATSAKRADNATARSSHCDNGLELTTQSGMKEELKLYGNELNYANAFWSAA